MKRRDFLKNFAHITASSAYLYGLQSLLDTCLQSNQVLAQSGGSLNYVNFMMEGAPPRWMFDQPLRPYSGAPFKAGTFGTAIIKTSSGFHPQLASRGVSFGGKTVLMPPLWALKSVDGQPFSKLLEHAIMIRGVDMEINSHTANRARTIRPVSSRPSITGLVAEAASTPFAASGVRGAETTKNFKSESGLSTVSYPRNNPIPALLDAFQGEVPQPEEMAHSVNSLVSSLDDYAFSRGLPSLGAEKFQMAAYDVFAKNLDAFNQRWNSLYTKYRNIVNKELRSSFPGVTDVNPVSDGSGYFRHDLDLTFPGSLMGEIQSSTNLNDLAQTFAFAEFALTEKLSSSLTLNLPGSVIRELKSLRSLTCDQHRIGVIPTIFFDSLMYKALAACLLEFTSQLQAAGLFDQTVIHITSEFSRTPRGYDSKLTYPSEKDRKIAYDQNGTGSEHGFGGSSTTIISGMISQPGLIGNIRVEPESDYMRQRYPGTWGEAAPFSFDPNLPARKIVNDDVVNTLCAMLEIRRLAVKGDSFIKKQNGKVVWTKDWKAENV